MAVLSHNNFCERFKSLFSSHLCSCASFRLIRQINIFQRGSVCNPVYSLQKFRSHFTLLRDSINHGFTAFFQSIVVFLKAAYFKNSHLVEAACNLFSISTDKRNRIARFQHIYHRLHVAIFNPRLFTYFKNNVHGIKNKSVKQIISVNLLCNITQTSIWILFCLPQILFRITSYLSYFAVKSPLFLEITANFSGKKCCNRKFATLYNIIFRSINTPN